MTEKLSPEEEQRASELATTSPRYVLRSSAWLMLLIAAVVAIAPLGELLRWRAGWLVSYAMPALALYIAIARNEKILARLEREYALGVIWENGWTNDEESFRVAGRVWRKNYKIGDAQGMSILILLPYCLVTYGVLVFRGNPFDVHSASGWLAIGGDLLTLPLAGLAAVMFAAAPSMAIRYEPINFRRLRSGGFQSGLSFERSDYNDIELIRADTSIKSALGRVESYTIESTLVSALAFSGFLSIVFSDDGPIQDVSWLLQPGWSCFEFFHKAACYPIYGGDKHAHLMFLISGCLLTCSVFFLCVLISRVKFGEASKHILEIFGTAQVLNGKAGSERDRTTRKLYAREVRVLISKVEDGLDDLLPFIKVMKWMRVCGLLTFILAVALCGAYFHPYVGFAIVAIVVAVYLFGIADKWRRHYGFLSSLKVSALTFRKELP